MVLMIAKMSLRALYALERKSDLWTPFDEARARSSRLAWDKFSIGCDSGPIAKTGVVWQPIAQEWADRLLAALENSKPTRLVRGDYSDGYMATLSDLIIGFLNIVNDYRTVTPEFTATLRAFLGAHGSQITRWLNHPWSVCSIRPFNLKLSGELGSRHVDGWPPAIRKVFILPRGASAQTGTTWFRLRDGSELLFDHPSPCWLMFENNTVEHAMMPGKMLRPTIELDLTPARQTSMDPVYAGLNGWYPWFPENSSKWHLTTAMQSLPGSRRSVVSP